MEKVEVKRIKFIKDANDIRRPTLGKRIKKDTELTCSGKALELFINSGVAKVIPHKKEDEAIKKTQNDK